MPRKWDYIAPKFHGDCSPPSYSMHGIFQARILEWVVISYSRGSSDPRIEPCPLCLLHWQAVLLPLSHLGSPKFLYSTTKLKVWKICIEFLLDLCKSRKTGYIPFSISYPRNNKNGFLCHRTERYPWGFITSTMSNIVNSSFSFCLCPTKVC